MLSKYGLASSVAAGQYNIAAAPLYFVRSGHVNLTVSAGTFRYAGQWGYDWSSRGSSTRFDGVATPSAYVFAFSGTGVNPSHGPGDRFLGFPLRCLSTVLDM